MSLNRKSIVYRCLVALLCLVCMIVFTYSWFNRDGRAPTSGDRMLYSDNVNVNNSANLSMNTYLGTVNNDGEVIYSSTAISEDDKSISGLVPGDKIHYKTVIKNIGSKCKATLLLKDSSYTSFGTDIKFGVLEPMNTLKSYTSGSDVELVRNVTVPAKNGSVDVCWYVYLDSSSTVTSGTMNLGNLYLFAN